VKTTPGAAFLALLNRTTPLFHSAQPRANPSVDRVARIRPVTAAAMFGGLVGLAIGCAYMGGTVARATTLRAQAERLEGATSAGFTEEALAAAAGGLDESALTIARRHDPYTVAGGAQRDRQAELMTARLEQLRGEPTDKALRRISLGNDPARPFRMGNALDASRDLECLTQAAYYEARGEGRDGMEAVAQVVLNRVRHPAFPKSICGVVFQGAALRSGCQFSFTCDGSMRGRVNPVAWDRARDVASRALSGAVFAQVGNATHFHTTGVSPGWRDALVQVSQVGHHLFYRFGGRSGSSAAFTYAARPSGDRPQLMQASLDPTVPVRQAGQAVAYSMVLAQEALSGEANRPAESRPTAPAAATTAPAPAPAATSAPRVASAERPAAPTTASASASVATPQA
jgi:spore germination cell wall hydrolase CwlJ-like protein